MCSSLRLANASQKDNTCEILFYTICADLNEVIDDEVYATTLAGSQLAIDLLEDGSCRRQPKYAKSLVRLALRVLDLAPVNSRQRQIADLYDPTMARIYQEELERYLVSNKLDAPFVGMGDSDDSE